MSNFTSSLPPTFVALLLSILITFQYRGCQGYNGLKISSKPCKNTIGEEGTCMFAWECIRSEGKRLGTCADGFLFGMCCGLKKLADSPMKNHTVSSILISSTTTTTTPRTTPRATEATTPSTTTTRFPSPTSSYPLTILKIKVTGVPSTITSSGGQRVTLKPRPSSPVTHIVSSSSTPSLPNRSSTLSPINLVGFPSTSSATIASSSPPPPVSIGGGVPGEVAITSRPQVHFPSSTPFTSSIRTSLNPFVSSLRSTLSTFSSTTTSTVNSVGGSSTPSPSIFPSSTAQPTLLPVVENGENDILIVLKNDTNPSGVSPSNSPLIATTPSPFTGVTQPPPPLTPGAVKPSTGVTVPDPNSSPSPLQGIDSVCGRRRMSPKRARIVGGLQSKFSEWPWMVSLRQWKKNAFLHKCGAALLNNYWAVTAAHCVENVAPNDLLLRLGEFDVSHENEPYPYIERRVQIIAPHPEFDPRTFEYDLALLRFYEPVHYRPNIVPICVPSGNDSYVGKFATVTGWGRLYEDGPLPDTLQHVDVPVITNKECETMYRKAGYVEEIPNIFICAGLAKGSKDSCEGDSGGPLVHEQNGKWQLIGIISWGIGCALPNQPGVYTRITEFSSWINQIIAF